MLLYEVSQESGSAYVVLIRDSDDLCAQADDYRFVVAKKQRDHLFSVPVAGTTLAQLRQLEKFPKRAYRFATYGKTALGHGVDDLLECLILGIEKIVHFAEARPHHVPVKLPASSCIE
jgi:hypothetical protein